MGPRSLIGAARCQAKNAVIHLSRIQKWPEASEEEMKLLSLCFWEILRLSIVTGFIFKLIEGNAQKYLPVLPALT